MFQKELLRSIQKQLSNNTSLIDAVATALQISYDASHRRVRLKSKISLDEGIQLARYYNIALDGLFDTTQVNYVSVERTKQIKSETDLQQHFEETYTSALPLLKHEKGEILYSAKDIPLFYHLEGDRLGSFKMYVWLKLLNPDFRHKTFESYAPSVLLIESARKLGELYNNVNTKEIWDITTINSTLKQIHFYFHAGQINTITAIQLCENLKDLIQNIYLKLTNENNTFQLFYNEMHLMNNHALLSIPGFQSLYVPFTILSYYKTNDKITCREAEDFLRKQIRSSKLLNSSGEKERNSFFNKMYTKIRALQESIKAHNSLDFE